MYFYYDYMCSLDLWWTSGHITLKCISIFAFTFSKMEKLVKFSLIHSNCESNSLKLKDVELQDILILNITICRIRERKIEKILFSTGLHQCLMPLEVFCWPVQLLHAQNIVLYFCLMLLFLLHACLRALHREGMQQWQQKEGIWA